MKVVVKGFCCLIPEMALSFINEGRPGAQQPSSSATFVTGDLERKHPAKRDSCAAAPPEGQQLPSGSCAVRRTAFWFCIRSYSGKSVPLAP